MPKKPPPSLPISAFSPITPAGSVHPANTRRNTPIITIDAHVGFPLCVPSDRFPKLWLDSVSSLRDSLKDFGSPIVSASLPQSEARSLGLPEPCPFRGFIYIHPQPLSGSSPIRPAESTVQSLKQSKDCLDSIKICPALAEVVWAPLAEGPVALKAYLDQISTFFTSNSRKLVGCAYCIQSPSAVARTSLLDPALVGSLKLLGEKGLGVEFLVSGNPDRSAPAVLEEILECVAAVRNGQQPERETKFLICEMGKPEMISSHSIVPSSASYSSILSHLFSLSLFSNLTIKLSGLPLLVDPGLMARACAYYDRYKRPYHGTGFTPTLQVSNGAETSPDEAAQKEEDLGTDRADGELVWRELKKRMKFYLEPILEAFGDHRIMYSSDFPTFGTLFGVDQEKSESWQVRYYECQFEFYRECLSELGLEDQALDNVFGLNAQKWYGL